MPIEIRELQIKAVIDTGKKSGSPEVGGTPLAEGSSGGQGSEQLVDICVEKVLEILREKTER